MSNAERNDERVVIFQTAFLGDTLLSIPLAKSFKKRGVKQALVCRRGFAELFLATELFDQVFEVEKGKSKSYASALRAVDEWWETSQSRTAICPHESMRSRIWVARLGWNSLIRSNKGIQFRSIAYKSKPTGLLSLFLTSAVERPMSLPEALRQQSLLASSILPDSELWKARIDEFKKAQGSRCGGVNESGALIEVPDWASMEIVAFTRNIKKNNRIVLAPGSVWKTKQWTKEGYAAVGIEAVHRGFGVDIVGSKQEQTLCQEIAQKIAASVVKRKADVQPELHDPAADVRCLAGEISLLETIKVIAQARQAFVNDSGAMHMACAVQTPVVSIWGPTVLDFGYRPWSNDSIVVEPTIPLPCRPCGKHGRMECPIGTHACMTSIEANRVIRYLLKT